MDNNKIQLIGEPCGYHGPYAFFKAFKYYRNGKHRILSLSDFFFVKLWSDLDLMSIGEVQLLWMDKNSEQVLASLRLYFLPENTPEGRTDEHGEDEVLAISEKVVLRVEDLLDRIIENADWSHGLTAAWDENDTTEVDNEGKDQALFESAFDFEDIIREKRLIGDIKPVNSSAVVVLSFPHYCRYRGIMKRLEGVSNKWARNSLVITLGGFAAHCKDTRVVFCKDTFDYPDLEGHELLCNHLAPNLKGRPRRKRKKRSVSPGGSESNESESSLSTVSSVVKVKHPTNRNGIRCNNLNQPRRSNRVTSCVEEKEFLVKLHGFMKSKHTPIGRVPNLGFKEIDLFAFYKRVQKLGGYNVVTANRMWKLIYDEIGGDPRNTSAATTTRRHYERLLLPYELNIRGQKTKHFPEAYPRQEYDNTGPNSPTVDQLKPHSASDTDTQNVITNGGQKDVKVILLEGKMSALRSVRPKGEKLLEILNIDPPPDKENIPLSNVSDEQETLGEGSGEVKVEKPIPELIDISEQDSPAKIGKTSLPNLKKRKLEILKEGGLEVTAISSPTETSVGGPVQITSERRPSVIQRASPLHRPNSRVSITVTPDIRHMLDTRSPPLAYDAFNPSRGFENVWSQQPVTQSRSIYAHSQSQTIYGNPKDGLLPTTRQQRSPTKPVLSVEVLDLRVNSASQKPTYNNNNNHESRSAMEPRGRPTVRNLSKKSFPLPAPDGRTLLGSNLEITVVDVNNRPQQQQQHHQQQQHQQHQQQQQQQRQQQHRHRHSQHQRRPSTHRSKNENDRQNNRQSQSTQGIPSASGLLPNGLSLPYASSLPLFSSSYLENLGRDKASAPFTMPLIDPSIYYQGLYNSQMYPSTANFMSAMPAVQQQPPPIFAPTAENFQLYKDLMSHQQTLMRAQQNTAGFLGLPRDGSTSITPISQATNPTSK